jgi:hypothetical protein
LQQPHTFRAAALAKAIFIMLGRPTSVMNPQQKVLISEPLKKLPRAKNSISLFKFMGSISNRRPLNIFRTSSFHSQGSRTSTAASDLIDLRFEERPAVHFILSRHDYTTEELRASWYQDDEYARMTTECCKQIRRMEEGQILKDKKYCSRGLESHTRLGTISKSKNQKLAISTLLEDQVENRQLGVDDEEALAQHYNQATSSCQLWATAVGLRDQKEAERCMD